MILGNWVCIRKQPLALQSAGALVIVMGIVTPDLGKLCVVGGPPGLVFSLIRRLPHHPGLTEAYGNGY